MSARMAAAALLLASAGAARADTVTREAAHILTLNASGGDNVTIAATGDGPQGIVIRAPGECTVSGDGGAAVVDTGACRGELSITVPRGAVLTLTGAGGGDISVTGETGPLVATMTGNGDLRAERVADLVLNLLGGGDAVVEEVKGAAKLELSGQGDTRIKSVLGPLMIKQHGSGDFVVGRIASPGVQFVSDGSGDAMLGGGDIAALTANLGGSGDLAVAASVGVANLNASGSGDIKLTKVRGPIKKHATGEGSISVADAPIEGFALEKASELATNIDGVDLGDAKDRHGVHVVVGRHRSEGGGGSVFGTLLKLGLLVWVIVMVRRSGVLGRMLNRAPVPAGPAHPGVLAVREALGKLDARLGRVEGYVTSREFELQRKFRELEK